MTQRVALWLAGAMTAFVVVVMCGVAAMVVIYQFNPSATSAQVDGQTTVAPAPQANVENNPPADAPGGGQAGLQASTAPKKTNTNPAPVVTNPSVKLTAQQATAIATNAAPRVRFTRAPELVNLDGVLAYEFVSERGTLYVDANTGIVSQSNSTNRERENHRDDNKAGDHD